MTTGAGQGQSATDNKSENKDRREENFPKARNRLGTGRDLLRASAESEVSMVAGAGGGLAPLTHANATLKHQHRSAAEVGGAAPPRVIPSLADYTELMGANTPALITGIFQKGRKKKKSSSVTLASSKERIMSGAGAGGGKRDLVAQVGTRLSARLIISHEKSKASLRC